ncbi:hypothetical protein FG386_002341 [Cryptosporidium ryanae]|uniref:uncharacterized protein n=1 Tax=Cryptosporidium ryanae TaxID=515981 RepID=UPI00351A9450|nr:hypothetical protein FG386_002341 [Cryptosporidium ryanae]
MLDHATETNTLYGEDESIKTIRKKPVWISRKIVLDISGKNKNENNYSKNEYSHSKYNYLQFIIVTFWGKCKKIPIIIGLISFIISLFMNIEGKYKWLFLAPSLFFSIFPPFIVDLYIYTKMRIADYKVNNKHCFVFESNKMEFILTKWKYIKVGDLICILDGEQFPADVVILHSSGKMAYISSEMVDGSRLKRACEPTCSQTDFERAVKDIILTPGKITCDVPSDDIYHFEGSLKWEGKPRAISLNKDNFVQMFSKLTFANWVLAVVVYAGKDTRISCKKHFYENKSKYYPRMKFENTLSLFLTFVITVFIIILFILIFINNESKFDNYSNYFTGSNGNYNNIYKSNWKIMIEFILLFNMCIPVTVTAVTDLIRIFEFIKLSFNKSILNDINYNLNLTNNESRNNSLLLASKYLSKINNSNLILDNKNKEDINNNNKSKLECFFHKYNSLDSFGEVDFSLITQDSIMEAEPMRLKFISLNNGQEYIFKNGLEVNASPKFSIISGLVWRHHSISWHRNEPSRFINGHMRVVRPNIRSSMFIYKIIHPKKLELFNYHSVISAISKLDIFKENNNNSLISDSKSNTKNSEDKVKMRKYYKKTLFKMKELKNTYLDEPSESNIIEYRNTWPPLSLVRTKKSFTNLNKKESKTYSNRINNKSYLYHPALPIHLFPKRLTILLNQIVLSNKKIRSTNFKLTTKNSDIDLNDNEYKRENSVFGEKSKLINKEENEEILYLMFKNIIKLTNSFYGWKTNQKYELFDEYSAIIKNLLIETINYTLINSFCDTISENKRIEYSLSNDLNVESKLGANYESRNDEYYCDSNINNSVLIDMLYAMATCNSSVPHLRILDTKYKGIDESELYPNNKIKCGKNNNMNDENKILHSTNNIIRSLSRDSNYKFNYSSSDENGIKYQLSRYSIKNSLVSFNDLSTKKSGSKLHFKGKRTIKNKIKALKLLQRKRIANLFGDKRVDKLKIYKNSNLRLYSHDTNEITVNDSSENNNLLTYRYNKEYEKLHNQRRKCNLVTLPREMMLTKYFIKYTVNMRNDISEYKDNNINTILNRIILNKNKSKLKHKKSIFSSNRKRIEFKNILKRLKYSFKSDKNEKVNRYYESHPKSYVQYSGIDENDLTIVNTAASFGMRLVLVNSQHIVVESLGRTIFASLIYKYEDSNNDMISIVVKFPQIRESVLYTRGLAKNMLPLINPQSIKSNVESSSNNNYKVNGSLCSDYNNRIKSYDDLLYITKKLDYQGYKVYIYAKKVLSKTELNKIRLRRNLTEKNENFKFLLNKSTEDYYINIRNNLDYLGYIGIEYRIQDKVPKTIKSLMEYSIKPWFLFNISSTNSIRLMHKIFSNYDKIPLIRMDRLPLSNKRKTVAFLVKIYNELKIIVKNKYLILKDFDFELDSITEGDYNSDSSNKGNSCQSNNNNMNRRTRKSILSLNKKYSDVKFLNNLITISTLNGEFQLSQFYNNNATSNLCEIGESVNLNEWMSWFGNFPGHGVVNSLPGIIFSAHQLTKIFQSRNLSNYFFSIAIMCPYVVISDSISKDISSITDYLRNNVIPKPVILGISGNTGNVSTLSSCDISISVSNTESIHNKNKSYDKSTSNINISINNNNKNNNNKHHHHNNNNINNCDEETSKKRDSISINSRDINRSKDSFFMKDLNNNNNELYYAIRNKISPGIYTTTDKNNENYNYNNYNDITKNNSKSGKKCGIKSDLPRSIVSRRKIRQYINNTILTPVTDVTISKFHQVIPILSRAGRITSYRTGISLYNNAFKIFYLVLPHLIFQFYCQWSGTLVYSTDLMAFFVVFVTVLPPILYGFTGIDVPPKLIDLPFLYIFSKNGYFTNWLTYLYYLSESIFLSIMSFYFGILIVKNTSPFINGISSDLLNLSDSQTLYCIIGSLFSFVVKSKSFSYLYLASIPLILILTIIILFISTKFSNSLYYIYGFSGNKSYVLLLSVPLFVSYIVIFNVIWKIILYKFYPNPSTIVRDWWLIHIKQYTDCCKNREKAMICISFMNFEYKKLFKEIVSYMKTLIWSEWIIIKNHINIGITDNGDEYMDYLTIQNIKVPTLINSISSKYQIHSMERIKKRKESLKRQNVVIQPQINIIQPQIMNKSILENKIEQNSYYYDLNNSEGKTLPKDCIIEVKETVTTPVDERGVTEEGVSNNTEINTNTLNAGFSESNINSILESSCNSVGNLTIATSCTGNYLHYSNSLYLRKNKFAKPIKINYIGDNRIFIDKYENNINNWKLRVYMHAITIWNPKQIYISHLVPVKKTRVKGIKSLQFVQSLTKYSKEEQSNYIYLKKEYTDILNDNIRVGNIALQNNNLEEDKSGNNKCIDSSNVSKIVNSLTSITSLNRNIKSSTMNKKKQDSTLDLNINIINNSSDYSRINKFSDDVKLLLNPYKLTFKVKQLELEYQREKQIETYQQRYAIRVVLFVLSLIFLKLGPFAINLSDTNYSWVGIMCVLFCTFIFINFCLTYISGKYSLNVRYQFLLLILISVTSILATIHGFTLVVIFPILSFIVFRLGFIKGLYLTIIGFVCVIIVQFIWGIKSTYLLRFLPILIGINSFCGFLGYRSELLYRTQFLLKTYTNDLRERQRQILDTMLPSFIVERLIKTQQIDNNIHSPYGRSSNSLKNSLNDKLEQQCDNNYSRKTRISYQISKSVNYYKNGVEDRGIVSVLFCDIYDFQSIVEVLQPTKLVYLLDKFFLTLDCLIDKYNCTKIETVFETYLIASCLDPYNSEDEYEDKEKGEKSRKSTKDNPENNEKIKKKSLLDLINLLRFGLRMHKISSTIFFEIPINSNNGTDNDSNIDANTNSKNYFNGDITIMENELCLKRLKLKIGIHSGKVISGVVGKNKPQYALFGDTVNTASRMKSLCDSGKIQISSSTYEIIKSIPILKWRERRSFVKGKGIMDTYILERVTGSAYPNFTLIAKGRIRGKGVNSVQVGNCIVKLYPDFDLLNEYNNSDYTVSQLSLLPSLLKNNVTNDKNKYNIIKYTKTKVERRDRENDQVITKKRIANLMDVTLCFKDNNIEQKYLLHYYSNYTTLKTIEESLVIVVVTLVLQTLIYSVLPCQSPKSDDRSNYRILWTVRIVYISSILLSWLVLFSNYTSHQFRNTNYSTTERNVYDESSSIMRNINFDIGNKNNKSNDSQKQMNYESERHIGGPILFLNAVLAGGASILMLTILWQFTMVNNSISLWCDEEIIELLLLATVHHNAGLLFRYIILFDVLILFLLATILLTGININIEGMTVYVTSLLINIIAAYLRERTGRTIYYSSLIAGNYEKKAHELLITMLPKKVLIDFQEDKLKSAYIHKNVTFIFSDICGFTQWAMSVEAENVVYMLSTLYAQFDESLSKFGLFKLFTIGDAYVAMSEPEIEINDEIMDRIKNSSVNASANSKSSFQLTNGSGDKKNNDSARNCLYELDDSNSKRTNFSINVFSGNTNSNGSNLRNNFEKCTNTSSSQENSVDFSNTNHRNSELIKKFKICNIQGYSPEEGARRSVAMAHDMLNKISVIRERLNIPDLNMRIGLHYGECIGGIVGSSRIRYEVWGHDIIIGNKMESCGSPGNITISGQLYDVLNKNFSQLFKFNYIGSVLIKKQNVDMYRTRMRKNIQLKVNTFSNSKDVSNIIKRNILRYNLRI